MPIMDQYFHTHFKSYKLSTNNQNLHKQQKKTFATLIVLLKPQTTNKGINNKIRLTLQKPQHSFIDAIP
jgi:hypothetical protein